MPILAWLGITSMSNVSGDAETIALFDEFAPAGKLTVRTAIAPSVGPLTEKATLEEWAGMRLKYAGPLLRVAAMVAPYSNKPGEIGKAPGPRNASARPPPPPTNRGRSSTPTPSPTAP